MGETDRSDMGEELSREEREAIEIHKYYLSCQSGYDVGLEYAIAHWLQYHAAQWRHERLQQDMTAQWAEIQKHKWIESEKAGRDLGDHAVIDWIRKHAAEWRRLRREHPPTAHPGRGPAM